MQRTPECEACGIMPTSWSCRSVCKHMPRLSKALLGCCILPAALVVDCICDVAIYVFSPCITVRINRACCGTAVVLAIMIWSAILVSAFSLNGPHIAGVCVCRHSMWKGELATIKTTPLEDLCPGELVTAYLSCISRTFRRGAELLCCALCLRAIR